MCFMLFKSEIKEHTDIHALYEDKDKHTEKLLVFRNTYIFILFIPSGYVQSVTYAYIRVCFTAFPSTLADPHRFKML